MPDERKRMRSRKTWTTIAFLMVSSMVLAEAAGTQTAAPDDIETSTIEGFVVRLGTGEPLRTVEVMLRPEQGQDPVFGALTDANGRFKRENIAPGNYRLLAERDGYVDQQYGQVSPSRLGTVLVMAPGQEVTGVVIRLLPTGTIAGRIFSEEGEPLQGVTVRALRYDYQDGRSVLSSDGLAQTNDLGEYRLYWLNPGEYYISAAYKDRFLALNALRDAVVAASPLRTQGGQGARGEGFGAASAQGTLPQRLDQIYVDSYYPGVTDPLGASPIRVDSGTEIRGIDFTIFPTRAVTIRGRVVGPFSPNDGVTPTVTIFPRNSVTGNRIDFASDGGDDGGGRDGRFELVGIPPGAYTIVGIARLAREVGGSSIEQTLETWRRSVKSSCPMFREDRIGQDREEGASTNCNCMRLGNGSLQ